MVAFKLLSAAITVLILLSCTDSKAVPDGQLSEIDRDLASILSEADTPADTSSPIDKSILEGFVPKETKAAETDDDVKRKVTKLLDILTKDESMDIKRRLGSRFSSNNGYVREIARHREPLKEFKNDAVPRDTVNHVTRDLDNDERFAKALLDDLNDEPLKESVKNDAVARDTANHFTRDLDNDERFAKALLDDLNPDHVHEEDTIPRELLNDLKSDTKEDEEPIPKALLDDLKEDTKEDEEPIPKALLDDLKDEHDADTIPKELLDDLKSEKKEKVEEPRTCGELCHILMDELETRMTAIAKRGDKIPKRMFNLWSKYRTRRESVPKKSNLMM